MTVRRKLKRGQVQAGDRAGELLVEPLGGDAVVDSEGAGDQERDDRRLAARLDEHGEEGAQAQRPVDAEREDERVERGDGGGLRRREGAGIDAAEQDHGHQARQDGAAGDAADLAARNGLVHGEAAAHRGDPDRAHQRRRHHEAGDDAAEEQRADGGLSDEGVEDHRDGGRDDRPERRGGGDDGRGEGGGVAGLGHHADGDEAGAGGVGDGAAAHGREQDAHQHVHLRQAAPHPADEGVAEGEEPVRDLAGVHDVRREQEHRDGDEDGVGEQRVHHLLGDEAEVLAGIEEVGEAAGEHGEGHGHAERRREQHDAEQDGDAHALGSGALPSPLRGGVGGRAVAGRGSNAAAERFAPAGEAQSPCGAGVSVAVAPPQPAPPPPPAPPRKGGGERVGPRAASQVVAPGAAEEPAGAGEQHQRGGGEEQREAGEDAVEPPLQHGRALAPEEGDVVDDRRQRPEEERARLRARRRSPWRAGRAAAGRGRGGRRPPARGGAPRKPPSRRSTTGTEAPPPRRSRRSAARTGSARRRPRSSGRTWRRTGRRRPPPPPAAARSRPHFTAAMRSHSPCGQGFETSDSR